MTETKKEEGSTVALIKAEINKQLGDPATMQSLLDTTFKGMEATVAKRAMLEGMLRGFTFTEFLNRDVYAIPYGQTYSLVTSVDRSRKLGMRSGVIGVTEPIIEFGADGTTPVSCSVTVKRRVGQDIGEFTAKVYFKEYSTGQNLWKSKPLTMIAKVAEMHAYRKACPEELAQSYVEEEFQKPEATVREVTIDLTEYREALDASKTLPELERAWADMPGDAKGALKAEMEAIRAMIVSSEKTDIV